MLIKMTTHDSLLYIDSDEKAFGLINNATYSSEEILRQEVDRLAINKIHIRYNIPTINPRNADITFFTTSSGINHSVSITEGWYDPGSLMTELIIRLNSVSGASGCTFSVSGGNNVYTITGTTPFQFLSSSHVDRGLPSSGLRPMDNPATTIKVNTKGFYTSYLDFCVTSLKEGNTRSNTFSHYTRFPNSAHLFRQHVNLTRGAYFDLIIDQEVHNLHYSRVRKRKISDITIEIYDEFGDLVYEAVDVSYLSYALEISLLS